MQTLVFNAVGNLLPGIYWLTWQEFVGAFGFTRHRQWLLGGMVVALTSLRDAGCGVVYLDGSFVTEKERVFGKPPGDFDACWDIQGVDPLKLDPILLEFSDSRAAQKAKFLGELFPAQFLAHSQGEPYLEFFQRDKTSGDAKGIVAIQLNTLP